MTPSGADPLSAKGERDDSPGTIGGPRKTSWNFNVPYATLTAIALLIVWQGASYLFSIPSYLLPPPSEIALDMARNWPILLGQAGVTTFEVVVGFILSVLISVPLAALLAYSPAFEKAIYPLIVGSNTVPKVALAPLLLAWFGFGLLPKILIVVLVTFFPIVINSVVGLKSLPPQMLYLARSMGCSALQVFWLFRMPNALPSIFAGLKVASVLSVIGAVVAEFVGADSGLGYAMMVATSDLNIARQFAAILVLSIIGIIFFGMIGYVERLLIPWHSSVRNEILGL
jgi:ABC-type nitrate/sulfonate/bicarbonate transport system permease component